MESLFIQLSDEEMSILKNWHLRLVLWSRVTRVYVCVCVCVCVCGHVYVVYEDTNLYNDMGMT